MACQSVTDAMTDGAPLREIILHLQKHLLHVEQSQLARVMLTQGVKLARGDLVLLDRVRFGEKGVHVFHEGARNSGR